MATDEPSRATNLKYSGEVWYIRVRGWIHLGIKALGIALVVLGGTLLFAQTMVFGYETSQAILEFLYSFGIPSEISFLWYIVAGFVIVLISR